jgi:hypothetical protein
MNIDTINLLVFADGVSFRKSKTATMVVMLSSIIELPPLLRSSYQNIATHFLICSSAPDFELFFESNSKSMFILKKFNITRLNIKNIKNLVGWGRFLQVGLNTIKIK